MDKSQDTLTSVFLYEGSGQDREHQNHVLSDGTDACRFFTKPLQGSLFERFRSVLMGHPHINTLSSLSLSPAEERVGEKKKTLEMERTTTGKNGHDDIKVRGDVTTRLVSDWTVVAGRTRTRKKGLLPTTQVKAMPTTRTKQERKNTSGAHSFV